MTNQPRVVIAHCAVVTKIESFEEPHSYHKIHFHVDNGDVAELVKAVNAHKEDWGGSVTKILFCEKKSQNFILVVSSVNDSLQPESTHDIKFILNPPSRNGPGSCDNAISVLRLWRL